MAKQILIFYFSFICLASCTGNFTQNVVYHSKFNFEKVNSYSVYQRNSDFTNVQSLSDSKRNSIEIAIEKAMNGLNFHYVSLNEADLVVAYHIPTGMPADYSRYNKFVLFCQSCLKANTWQNSDKKLSLVRGGLVLDLIDPKRKRSVWRSVHPLRIKDKDNSREVHNKIEDAVQNMLGQYPSKKLRSERL